MGLTFAVHHLIVKLVPTGLTVIITLSPTNEAFGKYWWQPHSDPQVAFLKVGAIVIRDMLFIKYLHLCRVLYANKHLLRCLLDMVSKINI